MRIKQVVKVAILLAMLCYGAYLAIAKEAQPVAEDPELESRLLKLSSELRCLVCQNETLADSRADLAVDLRNQIREQMKAGKSDKEIVAFLTQRYGDFVLYRPPVKPQTYLLWFGPFLLLAFGLLVLFRYVKWRRELIVEKPLSDNERRRAEELLATGRESA
jgi:cytochrome c-type biogenesis protein CcmH